MLTICFSRSVRALASDAGGKKLDARNSIGSAANDRQHTINATKAFSAPKGIFIRRL